MHTQNPSHAAQQPCGPGLPGAFPGSGNWDEDLCPELQRRFTGLAEPQACVQARPRASEPGIPSLPVPIGNPGHPAGEHHRVGAREVREAWLSFSKAMQAHSHPGPRSGDLSVALASVIWPEPRQVCHRPRHTSCSPASAEGGPLRPSVLPALSLCPQHPPPPAWAWSPLCRPTTLQTGIWMVRSGCLSKGPMDWDA